MSANNQIVIRKEKGKYIIYINLCVDNEFDFNERSIIGESTSLKGAIKIANNYIKENLVEFDKTAFYPNGGGQPNDTGKIIVNYKEYDVVNVTKNEGHVFHHLASTDGLNIGDEIRGIIDWTRRYQLMKMHTTAHIIDAVLYKETGALATGGQLGIDKSRIDFSLDTIDKDKIKQFVDTSNEIVKKGIEIKSYFLAREEAMKIPGIVKLANVMPPNVERLRIIEIPDVDTQADGGTHVKNTKEIGEIVLLSVENRGKNNRRIYYTLK